MYLPYQDYQTEIKLISYAPGFIIGIVTGMTAIVIYFRAIRRDWLGRYPDRFVVLCWSIGPDATGQERFTVREWGRGRPIVELFGQTNLAKRIIGEVKQFRGILELKRAQDRIRLLGIIRGFLTGNDPTARALFGKYATSYLVPELDFVFVPSAFGPLPFDESIAREQQDKESQDLSSAYEIGLMHINLIDPEIIEKLCSPEFLTMSKGRNVTPLCMRRVQMMAIRIREEMEFEFHDVPDGKSGPKRVTAKYNRSPGQRTCDLVPIGT